MAATRHKKLKRKSLEKLIRTEFIHLPSEANPRAQGASTVNVFTPLSVRIFAGREDFPGRGRGSGFGRSETQSRLETGAPWLRLRRAVFHGLGGDAVVSRAIWGSLGLRSAVIANSRARITDWRFEISEAGERAAVPFRSAFRERWACLEKTDTEIHPVVVSRCALSSWA